jgi:G:T/U-mismatch repair DNA glycosylase
MLRQSQITHIFTTGKKAYELFNSTSAKKLGIEATYLPSTSPANRKMHKTENFLNEWMQIKKHLK